MEFCKICEKKMKKYVGKQIEFVCECQNRKDGTPDDTLMYEEYFGVVGSSFRHEVFVANSPFDAAGYKVNKDCPQCGLDFMTMIRVGETANTIYTCLCGHRM